MRSEANGINGVATVQDLKAGSHLLKLYTFGPTGSDTTGWYTFRDEPRVYQVRV